MAESFSSGSFNHMIPTTHQDRAQLHGLSSLFGVRPSRAAELALDWVIGQEQRDIDPSFAPNLQVHLMLSRNYRATYDWSTLGHYLHLGLRHFWEDFHTNHRQPYQLVGVVGRGPLKLPEVTVRRLQERAFHQAVDPMALLVHETRLVVAELLRDTPIPPARPMRVLVPFDRSLTDAFDTLDTRMVRLGLSTETAIIQRLVERLGESP